MIHLHGSYFRILAPTPGDRNEVVGIAVFSSVLHSTYAIDSSDKATLRKAHPLPPADQATRADNSSPRGKLLLCAAQRLFNSCTSCV